MIHFAHTQKRMNPHAPSDIQDEAVMLGQQLDQIPDEELEAKLNASAEKNFKHAPALSCCMTAMAKLIANRRRQRERHQQQWWNK